jgi:thiol-disulfide isomerase/thioredoxin
LAEIPEDMNKPTWGRRQILTRFSLGMIGTSVAITYRSNNKSYEPNVLQAEAAKQTANSQSLPEFQGIQQWLNSNPLSVADLKGNVALVQFWTFSCINCQRTLPYIVNWHEKYAKQGLQVIGIHTPEFPFERDINNIKSALKKHQITYPVPVDNQFQTWKAYGNHYWPHLFLADHKGIIQYDHIGEGAYDTIEQNIQKLLKV